MEKVIIVNPDAKMDAKQFAYAPLGPLYLAAILERDGFECELWDLREDYNSYDNPPPGDIYCLTAVTPQIQVPIVIRYPKLFGIPKNLHK